VVTLLRVAVIILGLIPHFAISNIFLLPDDQPGI